MRKSSPLPKPVSSPLPRRQIIAPLPSRRQSPSMSRRQTELLPLPRKQLVPLPSSRRTPQHTQSASSRQSLQTSPPKHSMLDDIRLKIFNVVLEEIKTAKELNNDVLMLLRNILTINKRLKMIKDSLINIHTIDLENLTITKEIVDILKMTDRNKIGIIMLRNITFDNEDTLKSFLIFLSKNTSVRILELNNIEQVEKLLESLKTYDELRLLEIINNKNLLDGTILIKLLINFKSITDLKFANNTADKSYKLLFGSKIDGYGIDFKKFHGYWSINITDPKKNDEVTNIISSITANILNNKIGNELIVGERNDNEPLSAKDFIKSLLKGKRRS